MPATHWIFPLILMITGTYLAADQQPPIALTPPQILALSEKARKEFLNSNPQTTDGNLALRVDEIGRRVAKESDQPQLLYRFVVVQGEQLQAYSFPGGTICLTESLARFFDSNDELAFAIAHEVAHIALRHHIAKFRQRLRATSDVDSEKLMLETILGQLDADREMEADRYAALYAVRARYRYTAASEVLRKLAKSGQPRSDAAHPEYSKRAAALRGFKRELNTCLRAFDEGTAALRSGKSDEAIESLSYFVAEFPNNVSGRVNLGSAYLARVRRSAGTPEGLAEVLPILPDPGVLIRGFYDKLDLEKAREHFRLALDAQPEDTTALAGLALVEIRLGDLRQARQHMDAALEVEPDDPELLLCSGNIYYLDDEHRQAESQYVAALSVRPDWAAAKKNLALTYERLEQNEEALALWRDLVNDEHYGPEAKQRVRDLTAPPEPSTPARQSS
jgi:predicted Zn-dependent protease